MRPIKQKIQSERGASITFALLLFLVCAVVGSSVLAAGSAAAGRLSQIAENDQRYYSVNSAARLLIELVEADEVKVTKETDASGDTFSYEIRSKGEDDYTEAEATESVPFASLALEAAYQLSENMTGAKIGPRILKLGQTGVTDDPLAVTIEETIFADNRLELDVFSKNNLYRIRLVFQNVGSDNGTEKTFKWMLNDVDSVRKTPAASSDGGDTP